MTRAALAIITAAAVLCAQEATAQSRGGRPKRPQPVAVAVAGQTDNTFTSFRQYGTWLDDATILTRGEGQVAIGVGYWRMAGGSQISIPTLSAAYGVAPRLQLAASVPFYRASFDGLSMRGLDDVHLSAKIVARDAAGGGVGIAVSPLIEVLSPAWATGGRIEWAIPGHIEFRAGAMRVYGSAGYFSRGAVFTGAGVEWPGPMLTSMSASLTQSHSLNTGTTSGNRIDAAVSVARSVTGTIAAYGTFGRTVSSDAGEGTPLAVAAGLVIRFGSPAPISSSQ